MSNQFKPGDLAMIVGSHSRHSPNIGRAVELSMLVMPGDAFIAPDGRGAMNCTDVAVWLVLGEGLLAKNMNDVWIDRGGMSLTQGKYLMPLRGDFAPEQQKSRKVIA